MNKILNILIVALVIFIFAGCGARPPQPYGPLPTKAQVEWQQMEMNMFCHFGPNTFTGNEWGDGTEPEDLFAPTDLDCRQWVEVARQAGMKGIILTAKHHDGFCLWPNPNSQHTVAQSQWRNGQGDILQELSEACHEGDLAFGIYISPWDRHDPTYGTPEYNNQFVATLRSAHERYGPIFEQWFDGANGEGPNGKKQTYDWKRFNETVLSLHPQALIFSDVGPGCRWVGNESGAAGRTCWSTLNTEGFAPGAESPNTDTLNRGNIHGSQWVPAETDVSIRDGWFYRSTEHPKSLKQLLRIYYTSVGRNSLLLLNVPPDTRGRIASEDSLRLVELRAALDDIFSNNLMHQGHIVTHHARNRHFGPQHLTDNCFDTYYATPEKQTTDQIEIAFDKSVTFNRVVLQEYIPLGQRIQQFHIDILSDNGQWRTIADETTVGYKRIVPVATVTTTRVRVVIDQSFACPVLSEMGLYLDNYLNDSDVEDI